jgi:hypothetical protein
MAKKEFEYQPGQQHSNMVSARLGPALKALNSSQDVSASDTRQFVKDIRDAVELGIVSASDAKVKSALSGVTGSKSKRKQTGMADRMAHRGRKAASSADKND